MFPELYDVGVLVLNVALAVLALSVRPLQRMAVLVAGISLANALSFWGPWWVLGGATGPSAMAATGFFTHVTAFLTAFFLFLLWMEVPRKRFRPATRRIVLAAASAFVLFELAWNPLFGIVAPTTASPAFQVWHETFVRIAVTAGMWVLAYDATTLHAPRLRAQAALFGFAYVLTFAAVVSGDAPFVDVRPYQETTWIEAAANVRLMISPFANLVSVLGLLGVLLWTRSSGLRFDAPHGPGTGGMAERGPTWVIDALLLSGLAFVALLWWMDFPRKIAWDLVRPVALVAGLASTRFLEVDVRDRGGLILVALLGAALAFYSLVSDWSLAEGLGPVAATGVGLLTSLAVVTFVGWTLVRERVAGRALWNTPEAAYRAAVESALLAPGQGASEADLAALRRVLAVDDVDHARIVQEAREELRLAGDVGQEWRARYEPISVLGEGAQGTAWLARARDTGDKVVVKETRSADAAALRRAAREARTMARLSHPRVVAVLDVMASRSEVVLVLGYAEGGSMGDRIARGKVRAVEVRAWARDALEGLEALHGAGVVHRDIKPSNLLLDADGRVQVADFGVASDGRGATMGATGHGEVDGTRSAVGTLAYMSPEAARGEPPDARSDLYGLGATLYEALAGRPYLDLAGRSDLDARIAIGSEAPRMPIPRVPRDLDALVGALLEKDPADRPQSAREALGMLS